MAVVSQCQNSCRPLSQCGYGYVRCGDGSCRRTVSSCPISAQMSCPSVRPYRCSNGACVTSSTLCISTSVSQGCPAIQCNSVNGNLFQYFGRCVNNNYDCLIAVNLTVIYNGCTMQYPVRCSDGECGSSTSDCSTRVPVICTQNQFKCNINTCTSSRTTCGSTSSCTSGYLNCLGQNNCPLTTPYRCPDGSCASVSFYPFALGNSTISFCNPRNVCPPSTPYMCDDGSCQGNPTLCTPLNATARCSNGEPAISSLCNSTAPRCPPLRPILCSSGVCVGKVQECVITDLTCPSGYKCVNGMCVTSYSQCIPTDLQASDSKLSPRCPATLPFLCPDGACVLDSSCCLAIVPACNDPLNPVKCQCGACAPNATACAILNKNMPTCASGYNLCEDGICRLTCPEYNGCPLQTYLKYYPLTL